jgi:hypothetical protein
MAWLSPPVKFKVPSSSAPGDAQVIIESEDTVAGSKNRPRSTALAPDTFVNVINTFPLTTHFR